MNTLLERTTGFEPATLTLAKKGEGAVTLNTRGTTEVVVGGARGVQSLAWDWPTAIVSAVDGVDDFVPESCVPDVRRLRLGFVDTTNASALDAFSHKHAEALLAFVDDLDAVEAARVIVHCRMGISRSPSLAYGIVTRLSGSASTGLEAAITTRTFVQPNALVVWRLDEVMGTEPRLWATFEEWARAQPWWPHVDQCLGDLAGPEALALLSRIHP